MSSRCLTAQGHGRPTSHKPELILNNFDTMLGRRVGRLFASLFCQDPNFRGRRVVTFHNQRDYIFFRRARPVTFGFGQRYGPEVLRHGSAAACSIKTGSPIA